MRKREGKVSVFSYIENKGTDGELFQNHKEEIFFE